MSNMRVSIGIWGSVMQAELFLGLSFSLPGVQLCETTFLQSHEGNRFITMKTNTYEYLHEFNMAVGLPCFGIFNLNKQIYRVNKSYLNLYKNDELTTKL